MSPARKVAIVRLGMFSWPKTKMFSDTEFPTALVQSVIYVSSPQRYLTTVVPSIYNICMFRYITITFMKYRDSHLINKLYMYKSKM